MRISAAEVRQFVDSHMEEWVRETVLAEAVRHARAANLPQKFIDGMEIRGPEAAGRKGAEREPDHARKGRVRAVSRFRLVNTWSEDDPKYGYKPLARFFEYGTKSQIWIEPKYASVLAFAGEGAHGSAIYYKSAGADGAKFSMGHYVTGLTRSEAMTNGARIGRTRLKHRIEFEVRRLLKGRM